MSIVRLRARPFALPGLLVLALLTGLLMGFFPFRASDKPKFYSDASVLQLDLQTVTVRDLIGGKKTVIFYFLPTCPHCIDSAPTIARLGKKYGDQIQFLGVASSRSRLSEIRDFQAQHQIPFPIVQDGGSFASRNGLRATPAFLLTNGAEEPAETYTSYSREMDLVLEVAIVRYLGKDPLPLLTPDKYHGSLVCSTCHVEEYVSWGVNHHSVAIFSLIEAKKEADPKCVGCHVVGFGKPTGFKDLETTPELANVGCESCHGMAGGHNRKVTAEEKAKLAAMPAAERYRSACVGCHDATTTIHFDLKKGIPLVGHHHDRTLSEPDWLARRSQLVKGEAARPLLEFPPGEIQGDKACADCHAKVHQAWQKDPHAKAMETLKKAGKDQDVSCVKCHAVLKDKNRPEAVDAYLPGVGCESCHGPGEAHVKARGGKGNIVALNKSCPVCVIDALCSSCHTKEQDPDFELEAALKKVRDWHERQR